MIPPKDARKEAWWLGNDCAIICQLIAQSSQKILRPICELASHKVMRKPQEKSSITLIDVANAAGVSAITVSRALRTPQVVSAKSRRKVEAAVDKLGYIPDAAASALASTRTDVIGLLIPSLTNSVFAEVLRGVYDEVEEHPFSIQIGNYRYRPLLEEKLIRRFLRQKPAGLIVSGLDQIEASKDALQEASCPVVHIMDFDANASGSVIGFSHFEAGATAARHLREQGYKQIGFVGARMDPRTQSRLAGFEAELREYGELYSPDRVVVTSTASSVTLGVELLSELLARAPTTDAIFCNNDDLAIGALLEAQRRGIRIPDDFGICGFNDLEMSKQLMPGLTSIFTPRYKIGRLAIKSIVTALSAERDAAPTIENLGFRLVARGSTSRAI